MTEPVWLKLQPEQKQWAKGIHVVSLVALLGFAGSVFLGRILSENAPEAHQYWLLQAVLWSAGSVGIGGYGLLIAVRALGGKHLLEVAPVAEAIELREDAVVVGSQLISLAHLKSIVLESQGYKGAPGGRTTRSGAGQLRIGYKAGGKAVQFEVLVESGRQLEQLRSLAAAWRGHGVAALIMD